MRVSQVVGDVYYRPSLKRRGRSGAGACCIFIRIHDMYADITTLICMNNPWTTSPFKKKMGAMQSYPQRRMQCQASLAVLGWPGDGDCYLMHKMHSGGWLYGSSSYKSAIALTHPVFRRVLPFLRCPENHNREIVREERWGGRARGHGCSAATERLQGELIANELAFSVLHEIYSAGAWMENFRFYARNPGRRG